MSRHRLPLNDDHEAGYQAALSDMLGYARHWRWLECGERGTGEAFAVEYVVHQLRRGELADLHDDECAERGEQAAQRRMREHLATEAR